MNQQRIYCVLEGIKLCCTMTQAEVPLLIFHAGNTVMFWFSML